MQNPDWQKWFEDIRALREDSLYGSHFGNVGKVDSIPAARALPIARA